MRYELEFMEKALERLRALPKPQRRLIGEKINRLQDNLSGDVKKLHGFKNKYRLRVGAYRVLFEMEAACIVVYDVGDRKAIYE